MTVEPPAFEHGFRYTVSNVRHSHTIAQVLADEAIAPMASGRMIIVLNGLPYGIWYDEHGATGDDGQPVRGDVTGDFELVRLDGEDTIYGRTILHQHVSPHGTSGYGNPHAKQWAAEQVGLALANDAARRLT